MPPEILTLAFAFVALVSLIALGVVVLRARRERRHPGHLAAVPAARPSTSAGPLAADEVTARIPTDDPAAAQGVRADQLRSLLLSKMSHDLRTPLNSVITLSQLLIEGSAGPLASDQRRYLDVIHRNGQTLMSLINDIVDLAGVEAGRLELEFASVDLRPLLQSVGNAATALARKKSLPLHVNLPRKTILAHSDEDRLRQVLTNLLEHAIGQTTNGYVELSAETDGERAVIRVSDTGMALTRQARRALFDDFLAGLGPFGDNGEASIGLGLVVAGRLIKLLGGAITVDSAEGEGTTFVITLPLATEEVASRRSDEPTLEATGGQVLLIEDDEMERGRVGAALERAGYDVSRAPSGQEGLALLRNGQFDAVVLDLVMPGMSGLDVLRAARGDERLASTPIIVLSALYMSKGERDVLGPGVAAVVRKGEATTQELTMHLRQTIKAARSKTREVAAGRTTDGEQIAAMMRPAHVLIVDDNADNLFAIRQILNALPVTIETATSGQEAIELCRRRRPDVIMMDVQLPGLSGLDASRAIRELPDCRDIPIIALTAGTLPGDRERVMAAQCSDYLEKPVQPVDVVSAVTRALQIQFH